MASSFHGSDVQTTSSTLCRTSSRGGRNDSGQDRQGSGHLLLLDQGWGVLPPDHRLGAARGDDRRAHLLDEGEVALAAQRAKDPAGFSWLQVRAMRPDIADDPVAERFDLRPMKGVDGPRKAGGVPRVVRWHSTPCALGRKKSGLSVLISNT